MGRVGDDRLGAGVQKDGAQAVVRQGRVQWNVRRAGLEHAENRDGQPYRPIEAQGNQIVAFDFHATPEVMRQPVRPRVQD